MQAELKLQFEITEKDFDTVKEVDMKLLKLAEELGGIVLTNDFNLNKVAKFQGVKVLNINELSNAVKPIFLPGEVLDVTVIKEGKEMNQLEMKKPMLSDFGLEGSEQDVQAKIKKTRKK